MSQLNNTLDEGLLNDTVEYNLTRLPELTEISGNSDPSGNNIDYSLPGLPVYDPSGNNIDYSLPGLPVYDPSGNNIDYNLPSDNIIDYGLPGRIPGNYDPSGNNIYYGLPGRIPGNYDPSGNYDQYNDQYNNYPGPYTYRNIDLPGGNYPPRPGGNYPPSPPETGINILQFLNSLNSLNSRGSTGSSPGSGPGDSNNTTDLLGSTNYSDIQNINTDQSLENLDEIIDSARENNSNIVSETTNDPVLSKLLDIETNAGIVIVKNFLNYFLNVENAAFLFAIVEQDFLLIKEKYEKYENLTDTVRDLKPTTKFIAENIENIMTYEDFSSESNELSEEASYSSRMEPRLDIQKTKDKYKNILDQLVILHNQNKVTLNSDDYVKTVRQQVVKEVNRYSFTDLLTIGINLQDDKVVKLVKSKKIKLSEKNINDKISNILNVKMFMDILSNMSENDIIIVLTSETVKNSLSQLYLLDYSIFILFRLLSIGIYFLYTENVYKTKDVIIRLKIIENIQLILIKFIKKVKNTINRANMGDVKIPLPSSHIYFGTTDEKTYNQLLDSMLSNIIIPTKIIDLFDLNIIKSSIIKDNKIEYFGNLNEITETYKKMDNNKKYFWLIIVILIIVLLFRSKIFNKLIK
jgi:hypothetical protein